MAISSTWSDYIRNPKISSNNKLKIFDAASRSVLFYGAQIWGCKRYDDVEKLLRFFIKKLFSLPQNTPNYMIHIETGLSSQFVQTLQIHFNYILKVTCLSDNRLPKILASEIIAKNISWAKDWENICNETEIDLSRLADLSLQEKFSHIIDAVKTHEMSINIQYAKSSQFHDSYSLLDFNVSPLLLYGYDSKATGLLIKARGGLLDINARAFKNNTFGICTICNLDMAENTFHFIGVCPIYKRIRFTHFNKHTL